jgi:hypothetical protein
MDHAHPRNAGPHARSLPGTLYGDRHLSDPPARSREGGTGSFALAVSRRLASARPRHGSTTTGSFGKNASTGSSSICANKPPAALARCHRRVRWLALEGSPGDPLQRAADDFLDWYENWVDEGLAATLPACEIPRRAWCRKRRRRGAVVAARNAMTKRAKRTAIASERVIAKTIGHRHRHRAATARWPS